MGYKQSMQRDQVLDFIKQSHGHMNADEVFNGMNKNSTMISLATVYRNLNVLVQTHQIRKLAHPKYGYVYDKTCDLHDHLHCVVCDQLLDFPIDYDEKLDKQMEKQSGWKVHSHSIVYEGVCESCLKEEKTDKPSCESVQTKN